MGMANFGAFMGGISQGQQQAQAQAERKQYLDMLMARQKKTDDDTDSTNEATTKYNLLFAMPDAMTPAGPDDQDSGLTGATAPPPPPPSTAIPGTQPMAGPGGPPPPGAGPGGPPPMGANPNAPQGGAMAPQPGQASQPARPMPVQGQPSMQGRPMPPQAGPGGPPPQAQIPGQRPMPGAGPQSGPGGPPQPGAGQPPQPQPQAPQGAQQPQQPQQPLTTEGALQQLQVLQQKMADPIAQKIASDPEVVKAHKMTSTFIDQLRKDNVGFGPGQRKPNAVEQKELSLLHQQTELAATKAAKSVTSDEKNQMTIASTVAKTMAGIDHAKMVLKASEDATSQRGASAAARESRMGGGGAGGAEDPQGFYDKADDITKKDIDHRKEYMDLNGGRPPPGMSAGVANQRLNRIADGLRSGSNAEATSNQAEEKGLSQEFAQNQKLLGKLTNASGTLEKNYGDMMKVAKDLKIPPNQPAAQLAQWLKTKGGDGAASAYAKWMYDVQNELAQVAAAGGTGQNTDKRMADAQHNISTAQTWSQLVAGYDQMQKLTKNTLDVRNDRQAELKKQMGSVGKAKSGGASAAPTASKGLGFKGKDGTTYTDADVQHVMDKTGMTREQVLAADK